MMVNAWTYSIIEADEKTNMELVEEPVLENPPSLMSEEELKKLHDRAQG